MGRAVCVAFVATVYAVGLLQPWMLFAATILISTLEAFRCPAGNALIPKILDKEYYEYGMSLDTSVSKVVTIIGTAMAGGMIAVNGISGAIYIDMATFLISAVVILTINSGETKTERQKFAGGGYVQSLRDGVSYVRQSKTFLFFIAVCIILNALLTPFNSLQAPLATEVLKAGATILSVISIAAMAGSMFGSVTYPWIKKHASARALFLICAFGICFYNIGLVGCQPFYRYAAFMYLYVAVTTMLLSCFATWLMTFMNVEFIKKVDEEYLARASGILTAANVASMPVMSFFISAIIGFTGIHFIFMGVELWEE